MEVTNTLPRALFLLLGLILGSGIFSSSQASLYTPPYTFVPNTKIESAKVNANFTQAAAIINNLDNTNIATGAAISPLKLNNTVAFPSWLMTASTTVAFGVGQTGDTVARLQLVADGSIRFGPGGATAVDTGIFRSSAGVLAIRNGDNTADRDITARNITASGTLAVTGATTLTTALTVANGGTGATTLTGYVKGSGTSAFTAQAVPIPVADGGTGAVTHTSGSYLKGAGTSAFTSQAAPIPITDGGTGATSATGNGAVIVNAGGTAFSTVAPGTLDNVMKSNGTAWTSASIGSIGGTVVFGGDGSTGAVAYSSGTSSYYEQKNATTVAFNSGTSIQIKGSVFNATSTITVASSGTPAVKSDGLGQPGGPGAAATTDGNGGGTSFAALQTPIGGGGWGGDTSTTASGGGGGASAVANGGGGGDAALGGGIGGSSSATAGQGPSSRIGWGGGSGGAGAGGTGGSGGAGGGYYTFCARGAIDCGTTGTVTALGVAGGNGAVLGGGGGGGGGGSVWMFSQTSISNLNQGSVNGGAGGTPTGTTYDGGGGGGGGFFLAFSPSNSGTPTVAGGAAGGAGGGTAGTAGTAGNYFNQTGTPNLPVVGCILDGRGTYAQVAMERSIRWLANKEPGGEIKPPIYETTQWLAAWYAKPGEYDHLCYALRYGGDESTANLCAVDVSEGFAQAAQFKDDIHAEQPQDTAIGDFPEIPAA